MCYRTNTGSATVQVTGGTPEYSFSWSSGSNESETYLYLSVGTEVNVTDANNCFVSQIFNLSEPEEFCQNGGNCTGFYSCECASGWNGTDCSLRK